MPEKGAADDFSASPVDTRTIALSVADLQGGGERPFRIHLTNTPDGVLHARAASSHDWVRPIPSEAALGPGERQPIDLWIDLDRVRDLPRGDGRLIAVEVVFQRLAAEPTGNAPAGPATHTVFIGLPYSTCPHCGRTIEETTPAGEKLDMCPFCFERLRPCPVCGALNSWLARRCVRDENHVLRAAPDWTMQGGDPGHIGYRPPAAGARPSLALSRRWSFPTVAPIERETALTWSAPALAYGLVAAVGATAQGEAHVYVFETSAGGLLWEPYPLTDPVYPERGGPALAGGRIFAATVTGDCVCLDAQRGTRIWERSLGGRVYGGVVPVAENGPILVTRATSDTQGCLSLLDGETGEVRFDLALPGVTDTTPAVYEGRAFVHDESGRIYCVQLPEGRIVWQAECEAGFDAAPVVEDGRVYSASVDGSLYCHDAGDGTRHWRAAVTRAPLAGMPASDGNLLYAPGDDGLHLVSTHGQAVRRYGLDRPVRSSPVVIGDMLLFGAMDGRVYGAERGRPLQTLYETGVGSQIVAAPAFGDGALFLTATNGVLYALSLG